MITNLIATSTLRGFLPVANLLPIGRECDFRKLFDYLANGINTTITSDPHRLMISLYPLSDGQPADIVIFSLYNEQETRYYITFQMWVGIRRKRLVYERQFLSLIVTPGNTATLISYQCGLVTLPIIPTVETLVSAIDFYVDNAFSVDDNGAFELGYPSPDSTCEESPDQMLIPSLDESYIAPHRS